MSVATILTLDMPATDVSGAPRRFLLRLRTLPAVVVRRCRSGNRAAEAERRPDVIMRTLPGCTNAVVNRASIMITQPAVRTAEGDDLHAHAQYG